MMENDGRRVRLLKGGDRAAFGDVVSRHYQSVYRQLFYLAQEAIGAASRLRKSSPTGAIYNR
jgi:hypothetical protein